MVAGGRLSTILAVMLLAGGCAPQDMAVTRMGTSPAMRSCAAAGGFLETRGRRQTLMCVHRFTDAGKSCTTKSDCSGKCLAASGEDGLPAAGTAATGRCQPDDRLFGCHAEIVGGKARPALCID